MASAVRSRPNHYETLGLTPAATGEEIERAFAREISPYRPRAFGGIAEVSVAYETLHDPAKRRAYDSSLGLNREPVQPASIASAAWLGGTRGFGPAPPARRQADYLFPSSAAEIEPPAPAEPVPTERKPESAKPAAPHNLVRSPAPEPSSAPLSAPRPRPQQAVKPDHEPWIENLVAMHRATADRSPAAGELAVEWKRPALAIGGLFVAVGLLGALAGSWAASDIDAEPVETAAGVVLPEAEARPAETAPSPATPLSAEEATSAPATPAPAARPRTRNRPAAPIQPVTKEELRLADEQFAGSAVQASELEDIVVERIDSEAPSGPAAAASLPLPNKVIARTIERIGYPCGQVAATTPVEGAAQGVFKVTCSSGQSYRAAPTRGRYHFRPWGGQ